MASDPSARRDSLPLESQFRVKSSPEFRAWLDDFAEAMQISLSAAVTQGLMVLAESKGFRAPPLRKPRH